MKTALLRLTCHTIQRSRAYSAGTFVSMSTGLWARHCSQWEHFCSSTRKPVPFSSPPHSPPPSSSPRQRLTYLLLSRFPCSTCFIEMKVYNMRSSWLALEHNVLKAHPYVACVNFIPFDCWIICCMYTMHFIFPFITWWAFVLFLFFAVMNMYAQVLCGYMLSEVYIYI